MAALRLWRDFANGCPIHRLSRGSSRKERSAYSLSLLRFQSSIFISSYSEDAAGFHSGRLWSVHYNVHCKAEVAQLNEEEGLPCTTCPTLPLNFQTLCWGSALPVSYQTECEVYSSGSWVGRRGSLRLAGSTYFHTPGVTSRGGRGSTDFHNLY